METNRLKFEQNEMELLKKFNNRVSFAFGEVYYFLYDEIFFFTSKLYKDTEISANDVIHDIFCTIWINKTISFDNINSLRSYFYISIRNGFKNYLKHKKCVDKYNNRIAYDDDRFVINIAESHIFSIIDEAYGLLSSDCAEVLKYYLEGWQMKDIAEKMNVSERTVYNKRDAAIEILKKGLSKDKFYLLLYILLMLKK